MKFWYVVQEIQLGGEVERFLYVAPGSSQEAAAQAVRQGAPFPDARYFAGGEYPDAIVSMGAMNAARRRQFKHAPEIPG